MGMRFVNDRHFQLIYAMAAKCYIVSVEDRGSNSLASTSLSNQSAHTKQVAKSGYNGYFPWLGCAGLSMAV